MGLDMNAYKVNPDFMVDPEQQTDLKFKEVPDGEPSGVIEIAYWRKFHHLHGWMHQLYKNKGGVSEEFNCNSVRLTLEDLLLLATDASFGLSATGGFFFGNSEWDEESKDDVLAFCKLATTSLGEGHVVFYDSWW
jgi:hypothetical protein